MDIQQDAQLVYFRNTSYTKAVLYLRMLIKHNNNNCELMVSDKSIIKVSKIDRLRIFYYVHCRQSTSWIQFNLFLVPLSFGAPPLLGYHHRKMFEKSGSRTQVTERSSSRANHYANCSYNWLEYVDYYSKPFRANTYKIN